MQLFFFFLLFWKILSRNCEFISHNSDFIFRNSDFISHNSDFLHKSHNNLFFIQWRKLASISLPKNTISVIIYSLPCHIKCVWLSFFYRTQKEILVKLCQCFGPWCSCVPVAQWLEHCVSSTKVVGLNPREHMYWQYKCIAWMHCKLLWIKA